jgi:hypothetical protein
MELVFVVALLIALAVLALRFGYDSRDHLHSAEERQARHGLVW